MPASASGGTANAASPSCAPFQAIGTVYLRSEPRWRTCSVAGSGARGGSANPSPVCRRTKSFIDTVSPARTRERSRTACATNGPFQRPVGTLKRHGPIPWPQSE